MNKVNMPKFVKTIESAMVKHSPEILTGIGIAGMLTTTVLAVKATPKALDLIAIAEDEKYSNGIKEPLTAGEKIKAAWKCYIPAATTCALSVACLVGASSVNVRRKAALAAAYKLSETALTEYKEKVVETIGEKKEHAIQDKIAKEKVEKNPVSTSEVIVTGNGKVLCYDSISGRYFESDMNKIDAAVNKANRTMLTENYVSLNEFYDALDLPETKMGDDLGWNLDSGDVQVYYSSQITDDGRPCIVLNYETAPKYDYSRFFM